MEEILIKLREAAEVKSAIAKQEANFWQKISEAVSDYQKSFAKPMSMQTDGVVRDNRYLDTKRAAEYLGLKYGSLAGWRFQGAGPKYKMGGAVGATPMEHFTYSPTFLSNPCLMACPIWIMRSGEVSLFIRRRPPHRWNTLRLQECDDRLLPKCGGDIRHSVHAAPVRR